MDSNLETVADELSRPSDVGQIYGTSSADNHGMPAACALCQRATFSEDDMVAFEATDICGDCKFLLEELGTPIQDGHGRRMHRVRRVRHDSSESVENLFSQEFSNIINLARQRQPAVSEHENPSTDADARLRTSTRTTPSGSGRWRRLLSDTESEGIDSVYGESESNVGFNGYRFLYGESDTISFSNYGGESDVSVDGHTFLDGELFVNPVAESDIDSDTDIDPMHAGFNRWYSDDMEEDDEHNEWEEADTEASMDHSLGERFQLPGLSSSNASTVSTNWRRQFHSPEFDGAIHLRIGERRQTYITDIFTNMEESEFPYNPGDYLDARGFEELIEHLTETDDSRRGAPPTAVSFVNSLPSIVVSEELEKQDGLACAICKDSFFVGTVVNQLPCLHLYHPSCILPWLRARSSCPLCRYELPTDDKDHEDRKHSGISNSVIHETPQVGRDEDDSSDISVVAEEAGVGEFSQGTQESELNISDHTTEISNGQNSRRWLYLAAAAPIVSLVGIVLVLWLGNPLTERRQAVYHAQRPHSFNSSLSGPPNRRENQSRRWWLF